MKTCFMFGNRICYDITKAEVVEAVLHHHRAYGATDFIVGGSEYGAFNALAAAAVQTAAKTCDITLTLLLYYHPAERPVTLPAGYDRTVYPPLEEVPRRFAIVKGNEFMIQNADTVICYAKHVGNSRQLLRKAQLRAEKGELIVENLAPQAEIPKG